MQREHQLKSPDSHLVHSIHLNGTSDRPVKAMHIITLLSNRAPNLERFGAEAIHNTENVVVVPKAGNQAIANFFSSKPRLTNGLTVREWLNSKSYEIQREFGVDILNRVNSGQPLPR